MLISNQRAIVYWDSSFLFCLMTVFQLYLVLSRQKIGQLCTINRIEREENCHEIF
jgi:hypothetical protein